MTETKDLQGNGDFRSEECINYLKQADVVVTNPPFSLFREYVAQLMEYGKKFIIIGNGNAVTYKEIFPLIKENKLWLGASKGIGGKFSFIAPKDYISKFNYVENGVLLSQVNNACWFTNVEYQKRDTPLFLYKKYNSIEYPKYDNYDAINVDKTSDIPLDYDGVMGVPITFLDKYCPTQFEIVGMGEDNGKGYSYRANWDGKNPHCVINGENKFKRIFIKKKRIVSI